ncbi:myoD family inhibitor [Amia ocellicauda]|uniref:myoD family inhibitor n=1 Tax=Amia ocellicauda TaxID=2972642 RepID=UPI003463F422
MSGVQSQTASLPVSADDDPTAPQNRSSTPESENQEFKATEQPDAETANTDPAGEPGAPEHGNNSSLLQRHVSAPDKSVTCQPRARSPACDPTLEGQGTETASLLHNGVQPKPPRQQNGVKNGSTNGRPAAGSLSQAASQKAHRKLRSNPSINSHSSKRSKGSSKSAGSQIPIEAQDDCCVHCILACLFCEFLTLCNIVLDCALCGSCASDEPCLCCCCASENCGDCDLPCDMDCGIIDACCESADCLEICMECCGLCFSS